MTLKISKINTKKLQRKFGDAKNNIENMQNKYRKITKKMTLQMYRLFAQVHYIISIYIY